MTEDQNTNAPDDEPAGVRITIGGESVVAVLGHREIAWLEMRGHTNAELKEKGALGMWLMAHAHVLRLARRGEFSGEVPETFDDFLDLADLDVVEVADPKGSGQEPGTTASSS